MKHLLLIPALLHLAACGSILSAVDAGPIEDDPGQRTIGTLLVDQSIETKAKVNINAASEALDKSHFNVVSYNGYVLIVGQVPDEEAKQLATATVDKVRGVRHIFNELEVAGNSSAITRTSDTLLTGKVKAALLARNDIPGTRIKVVTENGAVYLLGLLSRAEAERATETARGIKGVQKVVQIFEYIE